MREKPAAPLVLFVAELLEYRVGASRLAFFDGLLDMRHRVPAAASQQTEQVVQRRSSGPIRVTG
jgi:hypothetical protein